MAGNITLKYGTTNQSLTLTLTSITNGSAQQSTAVDNRTNLFQDALVTLKIKTNASGTSATGTVNVYAYGTTDDGTTYTEGLAGSNGSATLTSPPNLRLIGIINCVANAVTYVGGPFSVASAFGGVLPAFWGVVAENKTGATLDASVGAATYQGVESQYT